MKLFAATTAAALMGTTAIANQQIDSIVQQFQSYGYTSVEISQEGDLVTFEAFRDDEEREIVYDTATNTILSDETGPAGDDDEEDDEFDEEDDEEEDDEEDEEDDEEDDDEEDDEEDEEDEEDDEEDDEGDDEEDDEGDDEEGDDEGDEEDGEDD